MNRAGDIEFPNDMTEEEVEAIVKKLTWHGFERILDESAEEIGDAPMLEESALEAKDPTEKMADDAIEANVEESEDVLDETVADENKIGATEDYDTSKETSGEAKAYMQLVSGIAKRAKMLTRVTATESPSDNDKFTMRLFLVSLDFKGEEYKFARKLLLRNLSGNSSWRTTFEQITENLKRALDIVENCGEAYKNASDTIKKLMNQAIFEKFYISNDADMEFKVNAEFKPPFDQILEPVKDDIIRINRSAQDCSGKLSHYIGIAKDHIQEIFGCGLYTINNSTNMSTYSNGPNFFSHNSSSKVLLVEAGGVEPPSENSLTGTSPGAVAPFHSLIRTGNDTLTDSVAS